MNMQLLFPACEQSSLCMGNSCIELTKLKLPLYNNILNTQNAGDAGNANDRIHF